MKAELPIIQRTYDLVLWYVPFLNKAVKYFCHAQVSVGSASLHPPYALHTKRTSQFSE